MNTPGMARLRALRLVKDAMDRDWAEPALDLDAVAAYAGYSRCHFVRVSGRHTARPPAAI